METSGRQKQPGRGAISAANKKNRATPAGTKRFATRFGARFAPDFYRSLNDSLVGSSLGMGTYLGTCDDAEDERYVTLLAEGMANGLNVIDTAINYRCQRSERAAGRAIRTALERGTVARDEIVVCTKGGYIPLDGAPPASRELYAEYLRQHYYDPGVIGPQDVVAGGHCLTPEFIVNQLETSRANLGVECIDVYYLHNPEQQLDALGRDQFLAAIRAAFAELEAQVEAGALAAYGCATWNGFRVFPANRNHIALADLVRAAREVAGDGHRFRVIQLPVNLAMLEAVRSPTQQADGVNVPLLTAAEMMGVTVIASASLMQAQLTRDLPPAVATMFPSLETDAQRAIAFVRSLPVSSALVGMRAREHLHENLAAGRVAI